MHSSSYTYDCGIILVELKCNIDELFEKYGTILRHGGSTRRSTKKLYEVPVE